MELLFAASARILPLPVAFRRNPVRYTALLVLLALPVWTPLMTALPAAVISKADPGAVLFPVHVFLTKIPDPTPAPLTVPVILRSLLASTVSFWPVTLPVLPLKMSKYTP